MRTKLFVLLSILIFSARVAFAQASFDIDAGKMVNDLNANGFSINSANAVNGKTGGMTITGDTASGGSLTLQSTTNATKGKIFFGASSAYDGANIRLGIGTTSPTKDIEVTNGSTSGTNVWIKNSSTAGLSSLATLNDSSTNFNQFITFGTAFGGNRFTTLSAAGLNEFSAHGRLVVGTDNANPLYFGTNNAVVGMFSSAGGFSIGNTTDPGASNLSVSGNTILGGTGTPVSQLHVTTNSAPATRGITLDQHSTDVAGALSIIRKSRGTLASPTTVASGDYIGAFPFEPYVSTSGYIATAMFGARVNGSVTGTSAPTEMYFATSGGADDQDPYTNGHVRLLIAKSGGVNVGGTGDVAAGNLSVTGTLTLGSGPTTVSNAAGNLLASTLTGTVAAANGGTAQSSYTTGDILYASGSTALSKLADVAAGSFLRSGGTSTAPAWSTTTWPNSATLGDINYASASNVFSTLAGNTTTTKKFLNQTGNGSVSAAPAWGVISDSDISFTDITTGNASTTQHGYLKKLSGTGTQYMDGNGNWSTPTGSGSGVGWDSTFNVSGSDVTTTSTTVVDVTGLSYSASANHTYEIEAVIRTNSSSTAGMTVGVNYSAAGATLNAEAVSAATGTGGVIALGTLGTPILANTANNVDGVTVIRGFVVTGANAGNITINFDKVTSGTATVRVGSILKIKQIL